MVDSPTNNFCTWNPLANEPAGVGTLAEGNLKGTTGSAYNGFGSTMHIIPDGKTYIEFTPTAMANNYYVGVLATEQIAVQQKFYNGGPFYGYRTDGLFIYNPTDDPNDEANVSTDVNTFGVGDIGQLAIDTTANKIWIGKNNTWQFSGTQNPSAGTGGYSMTAHPAGWQVVFGTGSVSSSNTAVVNFGQDSSFAGNKTAQGNQDSNDIGDFYYEPPTDFLALCTSNLPDATVIPSEHFNTALYTGTGSSQSISVGFQPDATWIKNKSHAYGSVMANAVVGSDKYLRPYDNVAETTDSETISSFDSDGFSVGTSLQSNNNTSSLVSWNWKAATTASGTTTGSGTGKSYSAQYNTDAGFSIISYEGNGTAGHEIPHHLSAALDFWVVKRRPDTDHWFVGHSKLASDYETDFLILSLNDAKADSDDYWDDTKPTSSVFTCGGTNDVNGDTVDYIAYCWHSVDGYSRVGSYKGNGLEDDEAPFVYTGFRPAWVMIKNSTASGSWFIFDTKQSTYNVIDDYLIADGGGVGATGSTEASIDSLANGFKVRQEDDNINDSGETFIYLAFAETPFRYANAR